MNHTKTRTIRALAVSLLLSAAMIIAAGCGGQQGASSAAGNSADGTLSTSSGNAPTLEQYESALKPNNLVCSFVGEKFTDQKVMNEDEALAVVKGAYERMGADSTTELELTAIRPTETGSSYYIFNQVAGDVFVYGASVKLIVDKDGTAIGLVSAILPRVDVPKADTWAITATQAEELVVKQCANDGHADMKPIEGSTEQTIIPVPEMGNRYQHAWVVYTLNYDANSEMGYLAHYVDGSGVYLYAIPISEPHNADAKAGDKANFDFTKYEQSTWTGTLTLHDGTTREAEVPVLVNKSDNTTILGDAKRKILCADYAEWVYGETIAPSTSADSAFNNVDLLAYDSFIKVWDFYDSIGWTGPDGEGTPTVLLMNYVNKNGEPEDNALYGGRANGFQTFAFNRLNPDGENIDIIAHEFTHCVTGTTMTTNVFLNETGAINEGMSDVLGNLVEMMLVNKPETAWLIGDSSGVGTLRSMKEPREFHQPAFRWDTYYVPNVIEGTEVNDQGGVHENSSMLNIVSYKLDQAGMPVEDQFFFWMNVALAMTPHTDYSQMAQLLPWCMEQAGYPQYVDALKTAIEDAGFSATEQPGAIPAGCGRVSIEYNVPELNDKGFSRFFFEPVNSNASIITWPEIGTHKVAVTLPAGDYTCSALLGAADLVDCFVYKYTDAGWKLTSGASFEASVIHVEEGKTAEVATKGLPMSLDAVGK